MNKRVYRSALGKMVDMDALLSMNEEQIAVGNMKVNARGDELGPGGIVVRTRQEVMDDYYQAQKQSVVYTAESEHEAEVDYKRAVAEGSNAHETMSVADLPADILEQDQHMPTEEEVTKLRGSLADAVAKGAKVEQKLLTPRGKNISRI